MTVRLSLRVRSGTRAAMRVRSSEPQKRDASREETRFEGTCGIYVQLAQDLVHLLWTCHRGLKSTRSKPMTAAPPQAPSMATVVNSF